MNQFILLPSGLRVNADHILEYRDFNGGLRIIQSAQSVDGFSVVTEDMTAEELDNLLRGTAVTSPILELRLPERGEGVCFQFEGKQRHGIVISEQVEDDKIIIVSDGDEYQYDLPSSYTVKLQ